jgi:hypothetical protein
MPFGLKNAPTIFSRIVVKAFQEYIYKTMVYTLMIGLFIVLSKIISNGSE